MTDNELIEKVAREYAYRHYRKSCMPRYTYINVDTNWRQWADKAKAAIDIMRDVKADENKTDTTPAVENVNKWSAWVKKIHYVLAADTSELKHIRAEALASEIEQAIEAARAEADQDAKRWMALLGCARLRLIGSSGFKRDSNHDPEENQRHMGMEFWTKFGVWEKDPNHEQAQKHLIEFADAAIMEARDG